MSGRGRAGILSIVALLFVFLAACAPQDDNDAEPTDDASPRAAQGRDACIEGDAEDDDKDQRPRIQWQNTTVDIEAASRFGNESDLAHVVTTVAAAEDDADAVFDELQGIEDATVERSDDGRLFVVSQTVYVAIEDEDEGTFRFQMMAPLEGTRLAKNGDISLIVQLPRDAEGYEDAPAYTVELVSATQEEPAPDPVIHDGEDKIGERTTIAWHWCVDPLTDVVYKVLGD
jgi:hypothetical protein